MPKRDYFLFSLIGFLTGNFLGSFPLHFYPIIYFFILLVLSVLFLLPKQYSLLFLVTISLFFGGFYWTQLQLAQISLRQSESYSGEVELLSLKSSKPPQQQALVKLLSGKHQNKRVRVTVYDWTYPTGTQLEVDMTIEPSRFSSDRGGNIIGLSYEIVAQSETKPPNIFWRFRNHISDRLTQTLPEPAASLAIGLLTGAGDEFSASFKSQLQTSGTSHLVAVSGYNMTIAALMISRFGNQFGRLTGLFLSFTLILFYFLLTGMTPAVARGALFTAILLGVKFLGRPTSSIRLVLLCACIMAFFWPLGMIYSLSWQLSFLAFLGILLIPPILASLWPRFSSSFAGSALIETLSAQIPVLPLITYTFGTISLISPLTNITVLSLTPYAMIVAAFQAAVAWISIPLGHITVWLTYPLLSLIVAIIELSSRVPFAAVIIESFSFVWCIAVYVAILTTGITIWYKAGKTYVPTI